nr:hypothetical protein [uncultured Undibacterium sp.]
MQWAYQKFNTKAVETTTNTKFNVTFPRSIQSLDDYEITPIASTSPKITEEKLVIFRESFKSHLEHCNIRDEMHSIVNKHFDGVLYRVANVVSSSTNKNVSNRTVQAWLIPLDKPSSRTCPRWALEALKTYVNNEDNQLFLKERRENPKVDPTKIEHTENNCVDVATRQLLDDKERLQKWERANFTDLPEMLFKLEKETKGYLRFLHEKLTALDTAIENAESIDELKIKYKAILRENESAESIIWNTKNDITNKTNEFASEEGLIEIL